MTNITFLQASIIGRMKEPAHLQRFGSVETGAIGSLLQIFFNILMAVGGIYAIINIIIAGYDFISAGGNPEKIGSAWKKIWQTMLGLLFIFGAFVLAAILGLLFFDDATALLKPVIPTI